MEVVNKSNKQIQVGSDGVLCYSLCIGLCVAGWAYGAIGIAAFAVAL